jgi:hypothetical protein
MTAGFFVKSNANLVMKLLTFYKFERSLLREISDSDGGEYEDVCLRECCTRSLVEVGDSKHLWNVGKLPPDYITKDSRLRFCDVESPPLDPISIELNPVNTLTPWLETYILHPSTHRFRNWSFPFQLSKHNIVQCALHVKPILPFTIWSM